MKIQTTQINVACRPKEMKICTTDMEERCTKNCANESVPKCNARKEYKRETVIEN